MAHAGSVSTCIAAASGCATPLMTLCMHFWQVSGEAAMSQVDGRGSNAGAGVVGAAAVSFRGCLGARRSGAAVWLAGAGAVVLPAAGCLGARRAGVEVWLAGAGRVVLPADGCLGVRRSGAGAAVWLAGADAVVLPADGCLGARRAVAAVWLAGAGAVVLLADGCLGARRSGAGAAVWLAGAGTVVLPAAGCLGVRRAGAAVWLAGAGAAALPAAGCLGVRRSGAAVWLAGAGAVALLANGCLGARRPAWSTAGLELCDGAAAAEAGCTESWAPVSTGAQAASATARIHAVRYLIAIVVRVARACRGRVEGHRVARWLGTKRRGWGLEPAPCEIKPFN